MSGQAVAAKPIDVHCPECDASKWSPCGYVFAGQWYALRDFHEARDRLAGDVDACPECGAIDPEVRQGVDEVRGEWNVLRCPACGWTSDPY